MSTNKSFNYPDNELYQFVQEELHKRGITAYSIGEIAYEMQHDYLPDYEISDFAEQFSEVLKKREVLNLLAFAFELDNLANKRMFSEPIQNIIENDAGFWQIDEILASSLAQLFGMLAITNYGYLDKNKVGIARRLDEEDSITVFSDDIVSALASAVIGRCGHGSKLELDDHVVSTKDDYYVGEYEDFVNTLEGLANNALEEELEEEFHHDYYVNFELNIRECGEFLVKCFSNDFAYEYTIKIYVPDLYSYCYIHDKELFAESGVEYRTLAHAIAGYIFTNDLYVYPEDDEENNKEQTDPVQESVKKIAEEVINASKHLADGKNTEVNPFEELFKAFFGNTSSDNDKKENNTHEQ